MLRDQLFSAVMDGPYRSTAGRALKKAIGSARKLPVVNLPFDQCTAAQVATVVDHLLKSDTTNNKYYKNGHLTGGEAVYLKAPSGYDLTYQVPSEYAGSLAGTRTSGSARRTGGTTHASTSSSNSAPAPAPAGDTSSEDAYCRAVAPFEGGKLTAAQVKAFQKRFSCFTCLHLRKYTGTAEADRPTGWHHFSKCPCKPAGHTITFS